MMRKLKIEDSGGRFGRYKHCKPVTITLRGQWLAQAGFPAGQSVVLTAISPGVIEIRVIGTPRPDHEFSIAAMRLDHAIEADRARKGAA